MNWPSWMMGTPGKMVAGPKEASWPRVQGPWADCGRKGLWPWVALRAVAVSLSPASSPGPAPSAGALTSGVA